MSRLGIFALSWILLIFTGPTLLSAAELRDGPTIEGSFATEGPLSLFCTPNGGGNPFSQAFDQAGNQVDGTLTIYIYGGWPDPGDPIANFPREDIWLRDTQNDLAWCTGGAICDENTDANGMTYWSAPLLAGGHLEPGGENRLDIIVGGWILNCPFLDEFRLNSADLTGDLWVSLHDVALFSEMYFGDYSYAGDFHWDGVINLSDLASFAQSYTSQCP